MSDLIERQAAIDALSDGALVNYQAAGHNNGLVKAIDVIKGLPSAQPEPHYCRECKWSMCHINVDKYGSIKTYWHCLYWAGETDEEGFCHEWERNGEQP